MRSHINNGSMREDRYLLVDDTDEDASALLTIICDGDPRSMRGFDTDGRFHGLSDGGRA
jgi:hypothetical protein